MKKVKNVLKYVLPYSIALVLIFSIVSGVSLAKPLGEQTLLQTQNLKPSEDADTPEHTYANFTFKYGAPGLPPIDFPDKAERSGGTIKVVAADTNQYTVTSPDGTSSITGSLDDQYVVMDKTSTAQDESLALIKDFPVNDIITQGKVNVNALIKVDDDESIREFSLYADKTLPIAGVLIGGGRITDLEGNQLLGSVPKDTWFTATIILDLENKTYDVKIDGVLCEVGISWSNKEIAPTSFGRMILRSKGSSKAGKFFVDDILIKTTHKVNIRTEFGYELSDVQQTRTIPAGYRVSLPKNYDPEKKYPVILSMITCDPGPDVVTNIYNFTLHIRETRPDMPDFIIIGLHAINTQIVKPNTGIDEEEYPYNSVGWCGEEILEYNRTSGRPGETIPWSGVPYNVGSSFDEQAYIETFLQIKEDYNTDDKFFIDGASRTGYSIFRLAMHHPEYIAGAFGHEANCTGTGGPDIWDLGQGQIRPVSTHPDRVNVPVRLANGPFSSDMNHTKNIHNQYTNAINGVPLPREEWDLNARTFFRQNLRSKLTMEAHGFRNVEIYWLPRYGHQYYADEEMEFFKNIYLNETEVRNAYDGPQIPVPQILREGQNVLITNFAEDYKTNTYKYGALQYSFDGVYYREYLVDGIVDAPDVESSLTVRYGGIGGIGLPQDKALSYFVSPSSVQVIVPTAPPTPTPTLTPTPTPEPKVFEDVAIEWYYEYIYDLANKGIIGGYLIEGKWYFKPENNITREEIAKIVTLAFNVYNAESTTAAKFTDCSQTDWYYAYVGSMVDEAISLGATAETYGVGSNLLRQDLATMMGRSVAKYLKYTLPEVSEARTKITTTFEDCSVEQCGDYAAPSVAFFVDKEIIKGNLIEGKWYFFPQNPITRAEVSKIISLAIALPPVVPTETPTPSPTLTPDPTPTPTATPTPTPTLEPTPVPSPIVINLGDRMTMSADMIKMFDYGSPPVIQGGTPREYATGRLQAMGKGRLVDGNWGTNVTICGRSFFVVDLGENKDVGAVGVAGQLPTVQKAYYKVYVSSDGIAWSEACVDIVAACVDDKTTTDVALNFNAGSNGYQTRLHPDWSWDAIPYDTGSKTDPVDMEVMFEVDCFATNLYPSVIQSLDPIIYSVVAFKDTQNIRYIKWDLFGNRNDTQNQANWCFSNLSGLMVYGPNTVVG